MKQLLILILFVLIIIPAAAQQRNLAPVIGNLKGTVEGCGCFYKSLTESKQSSGNPFIFWADPDKDRSALMNINGQDVKLRLLKETPAQRLAVGERESRVFTFGDGKITIRFDEVITSVCDPGDESCEFTGSDATITVFRAGKKQTTIKATGGCGC